MATEEIIKLITEIIGGFIGMAIIIGVYISYKRIKEMHEDIKFNKRRILELREDIDEINNTIHDIQRKINEK